MKTAKRYLSYIAWGLSIAAYAYIGYKLYTYDDWATLAAHLGAADGVAYVCGALAVVLMPVNMLLEAWRWQYLVGDISLSEAQRQVYFSKIAGQMTPYQLGEYPARGLLMKQAEWGSLLSLGAIGSMTMTMAIVIAGIVPLIVWLTGEQMGRTELWMIGGAVVTTVLVTMLLPKLLRRWVTVSYRTVMVSIGQSMLRYLCWAIQLALVLRLCGVAFSTAWWIEIPVYYLIVTIAPSVSVAEVGVRGAAALMVFGTMEATLAGVVLWSINSLLAMLIGSFVKKNAK